MSIFKQSLYLLLCISATLCFAKTAQPVNDTLFDNYIEFDKHSQGKIYGPKERYNNYKKKQDLTGIVYVEIYTFNDESDLKRWQDQIESYIPSKHEMLQKNKEQQVKKQGYNDVRISSKPLVKQTTGAPDTYFLICKSMVIGESDFWPITSMIYVTYQSTTKTIGVAEYHFSAKDTAEFASIKASLVKFCTEKIQSRTAQTQNNQNESSAAKTEPTVSKPSSYWLPPFGMFRGICTVAMSPFNLVRAFHKMHNTFKRKKCEWLWCLPTLWIAVGGIGTIETVGDCVMGALDILSLGFLGNKFYSGDVTPWFWERDNDPILSWKRD